MFKNVKNNKGFTLVELLSTLAVLAIVLGIVSAAYVGITRYLKASFYKTLEESILVSGGEYYAYTSDRPEMFADEKKISLKSLVDNKYSTNIVDRKGNQCNLNTSYVGAYKDSYDKTNYYVCLTCDSDDYTSTKPECSGNISYSLQLIATVNDTNKVYQVNNWVNQYVKLTFKTLNDVNKVYVRDTNTGTSFNCTMTGTSVKTCSINVNQSGNYEYYGVSSSNQETKRGYINILVDKVKPSFEVYENTTKINTNNIIKNINSSTTTINGIVKNIVDLDSKVQSIRYSFEKKGSSKKYVAIDNNLTEFNITKTLGIGEYELFIEIRDYAGNTTTRTITYKIIKVIDKPDSSYCNNLTYTGYEQTLTKTPGEGYTFTNNKGTNAGNYEVTAILQNYYAFSDGSSSAKFTCTIKRQPTSTTGSCQNVTYNGAEQVIAKGGSNVTYSNNLKTDAGTYTVTINANPNYAFSDNSISKTLNCTLAKKSVAVVWGTTTTFTYNGNYQGPTASATSGVSGETLNISRTTEKNAGNYTSTASISSVTGGRANKNNYTLTGNTKAFKINKANPTLTLSATSGSVNAGSSISFTEKASIAGSFSNVSGTTGVATVSPASYSNIAANTEKRVTITGLSNGSSTITVTFTPNDTNNYNNRTATYTVTGYKVASVGSCQSRTYNGSSQTLAGGGTGVNYTNNTRTNYGSQTVTVSLQSGYRWSDTTTANKSLNCSINKKVVTIKANNQTITYGNSIATGTGNITTTGLISGHSVTSITLTPSTMNATTSGSITPSAAVIKSGSTDVTNNYSITYQNGALVINRLRTATTGSCQNVTYNGAEQVIAKGGSNVTYSNNLKTDAGTYTVTINANSNYAFSDGAISKTLSCSIAQKSVVITLSATSGTVVAGKTMSFTAKSDQAGKLAISSSATAKATVSPTSVSSLAANTNQTITVRGVASGSSTITVTATPTNSNYKAASKTYTATIAASATIPTASSHCRTGLVYNASSQTLTKAAGTGYAFSNNTRTNAGSQTVTATLSSGYRWSDNTTGAKTFSCSIAQKPVVITLSATSGTVVAGKTMSFTAKSNQAGKLAISSSATAKATVSPTSVSSLAANTNQTITVRGVASGSSTITVTATPTNSNYKAASKTYTATIAASATIPTASSHCRTGLVYNASSQTLTKAAGTGYTFSNNTRTNAGSQTVTATLSSGYRWSDNTTGAKTFSCSIAKKGVTITAKDQNLNGTNIITKNTSQITTSGLISGHSVTSITLTQSTTADTTNGTITPSGAVIKSGSTDVTSNYSITYNKGKLTIITKKYCANFYLNGASKIDGVASNKTGVCCSPGSNTSCTITSPTITPATNFKVLGWGDSASSKTITVESTGNISLSSDKNFYAVTISSEDSTKTYNIELNLNGATSFTLGGTTYNKSSVFTCQTDYAYNGGSIPTTCKFTLPTITRTSGTVYGWDTNENKEGSPTYTQGQVLTISSDIVLYAITSRTIKLSYNGNGGTTTLPTQSKEVYNDNEGVWFDIPAYDRANMCRNKDNDYVSYKYSGLATAADSSIVNYCQGNKMYATNDTTLYALWKKVYRTASHSVSSGLRVRSQMNTSSTHLCTIPSGKKVYLTGAVSSCISSRKWYPVIYGTCSGYSSAGSKCSTANFTLDAAVKNSCEYTDYYCSGTNYNLNLTPKNVTLNLYSGPTTAQLQIQEQCGGLKSATSSDTSIVGVDISGKVTAVSGSVASGSSKTATLTFTTNAGCTDTVNVVVKNINEVPPTVSISISGETYSSGYKTGAVATVTCESSEGISSYSAKDNTGDTGSWSTNTSTKKVKKITLSSASSSRKISVSCTSTNGLSASTSKTVKIYAYSASSACGVSSYSYRGSCSCVYGGSTMSTPGCNATVYNSGGCSSYCKNLTSYTSGVGTCSRTTNYKSCYHT